METPIFLTRSLPQFYSMLYRWYDANCRILPWRETRDPYCIWVSEIILQQTRVAQGLTYYMRFINRFPNLMSLAQAEESEVLLYWQGLGYYSRARNMHRAARQLVQTGGTMPADWAGLRQMPGVGDYTAGAIASFAYNMPYPALDGNVYRVLARLYDCDEVFDTSAGKRFFHTLAEQLLDRQHPRQFNSAIMELGALQCVPAQPDCDVCPVVSFCKAHQTGTEALLPVRKPRTALQDRFFTYTIYICDGQTLLYQRTKRDIWQHLWEFPLVESQGWNEQKWEGVNYKEYEHVLSHRRLHARFIIREVPSLDIELEKLKDSYPQLQKVRLDGFGEFAMSRLTERAIDEWLFTLIER